MSTTQEHLSSLTLDALALGALSSDEARRALDHLAACEACAAEAESAAAARRHFTANVYPRTVGSLRRPTVVSILRRPTLVYGLPAALAVACALAVFVMPPRSLAPVASNAGGESAATYGIKGGPTFQILARRGERVFAVREGAVLSPGDEIRFALTPGGAAYVLVASIDGAGQPSVYYPFDGTASAHLASAAARFEVPGSIVLDASTGPERVFALFSDTPLRVADVTEALRALGARGPDAIRSESRLPSAAKAQSSLVFEKRP